MRNVQVHRIADIEMKIFANKNEDKLSEKEIVSFCFRDAHFVSVFFGLKLKYECCANIKVSRVYVQRKVIKLLKYKLKSMQLEAKSFSL